MTSAQNTEQTKLVNGKATLYGWLLAMLLLLCFECIVFVLQITSDLWTSILCGSRLAWNCCWNIDSTWQLWIQLLLRSILWCWWLLHDWWRHILSIIIYVQIIERLNDLNEKTQPTQNKREK